MYYNTFLDSLDISISRQFLQNPPHLKIVELLIEKGYYIAIASYGTVKVLGKNMRLIILFTVGANVNHQDAEGNTALLLACKKNHWDLVKVLAEVKKVKIDLANHNGDTALHIACADHLKLAVTTLLTCGASVQCKNKIGHTPVFTACMFGDEQMLHLLLCHVPDLIENLVNDLDKDGNSPLMVAAQSMHCTKEVVELLLSLKSNLHVYNNQGNNVLHLSVSQCNKEIVELITDQDQSLLHKNNCRKEQPLHIAAKNGNKDNVFLLIER